MSLNSVNIMGNLTRDPELKYTPSGKSVCSLSIANNRVYTKNAEKVTEVSYFDVEVWGAAAENCSKYLAKGQGVIVEGRLRQDRWEKDGKTQSRVRISANSVHFLPKRQGPGGPGADPAAGASDVGARAIDDASVDSAVSWDE
jgi:single-strand DNA-binding protein